MADSNDDYWENWNKDSKGSPNKSYNDTPTKSYKANKVKKQPKKRKSNILKGIFALLIAAGLITAVFFTPFVSNLQNLLGGGDVYPEKADFSIKRTIDLETTGEIDYNIDIPVPIDIPGNDIQTIKNMEWGGNPSSIEKFGQEWMLWNGTLRSAESKKIEIIYDVETTTVNWGYSADNSGKVSDVSQSLKDRYNRNQWQLDQDRDGDGENDWMIQPESSEIRSLAEEITEGKDNIYTKSRALYDWINDNIEYVRGTTGLPQHTLMTLHNREGDCDEQSFLYCSLARSVDIPSWIELGILNDRVLDRWAGHGWVRQQYISDENEGGWVNIDLVNDQFFARDAQRVTSWVDDGIEGHLEDYYLFLNYTYSERPRVTYSDDYQTEDMETEGQVVLSDDEESVPGFEGFILGIAILFALMVYKNDRRKRK